MYDYLDILESENINKILNRINEIKNNKNYNDKTIKELTNYILLISDLKNNFSEIIKKYAPERINISCGALNKNFFDLNKNEIVQLYNILKSIKNIEWNYLHIYIETVGFSNLIKILHYVNRTNLQSDFLHYFNNFIADFSIHKDFNRIPILNELYNNTDIPNKFKRNIKNINNNDLILLNNFLKEIGRANNNSLFVTYDILNNNDFNTIKEIYKLHKTKNISLIIILNLIYKINHNSGSLYNISYREILDNFDICYKYQNAFKVKSSIKENIDNIKKNIDILNKFNSQYALPILMLLESGFTEEEINKLKDLHIVSFLSDIKNKYLLFGKIYKEDIIDLVNLGKKYNGNGGIKFIILSENTFNDKDLPTSIEDIAKYICKIIKRDTKGDNLEKYLIENSLKVKIAFDYLIFIKSFDFVNKEDFVNKSILTAYRGSNNSEEFINRLLKIGIYAEKIHNFSKDINIVFKVFTMKLDLSRNEIVKFVQLASSLDDDKLNIFKKISEKNPEKHLNDYNDLLKIYEIFNQEKTKIDQNLLNKTPVLYTKVYILTNSKLVSELEEKAEKKNEKLNINIKVSDGYYFKNLGDNNYSHFTIGADTNCCQRLGAVGENAAIDSFINPLADVLVLYNKDNKIISQSYFHYVPERNSIILDNVEVSSIGQKLVGPVLDNLYIELTDKLLEQGYKEVFCGKAYNNLTLNNSSSLKEDPRKFSVDKRYTDFDYKNFINLNEFSNEKYKTKEKINIEYTDEDYYENQADKKYNMKRSLLQLSNMFVKICFN